MCEIHVLSIQPLAGFSPCLVSGHMLVSIGKHRRRGTAQSRSRAAAFMLSTGGEQLPGTPRTSSLQLSSRFFIHPSNQTELTGASIQPPAEAWSNHNAPWGTICPVCCGTHIQTLISPTQKTFALHHHSRFLFLLVCFSQTWWLQAHQHYMPV